MSQISSAGSVGSDVLVTVVDADDDTDEEAGDAVPVEVELPQPATNASTSAPATLAPPSRRHPCSQVSTDAAS